MVLCVVPDTCNKVFSQTLLLANDALAHFVFATLDTIKANKSASVFATHIIEKLALEFQMAAPVPACTLI